MKYILSLLEIFECKHGRLCGDAAKVLHAIIGR